MDIEDDGTIHIASPNAEACDAAKKMIETIVFVPEVGALYYGKVVRILQFGAFVEDVYKRQATSRPRPSQSLETLCGDGGGICVRPSRQELFTSQRRSRLCPTLAIQHPFIKTDEIFILSPMAVSPHGREIA